MNFEDSIAAFIKISKYCGQRLDLVQAGGGNTSVKMTNGYMIIKASGYALSEVSPTQGYAMVDREKTVAILSDTAIIKEKFQQKRESLAKSQLQECIVDDSLPRPSIETFFHAFLQTYVIHTHPIVVNMVTCRKDWSEILNEHFPEAVIVGYSTPGIDLAVDIAKAYNQKKKTAKKAPEVIFLQNHGLIVSSDSAEEAIELNEKITTKLESILNIDLSSYRMCNTIADSINLKLSGQEPVIAYRCENGEINRILEKNKNLFFHRPFCPDGMIFNGLHAVNFDTRLQEIITYFDTYKILPKVVISGKSVYLIAQNIRKAKEIEDVLYFQLKTLSFQDSTSEVNALDHDELMYLANWEAEKYRQNI